MKQDKNKLILLIGPGTAKESGGGIAVYTDILAEHMKNYYAVKRIDTMKEQNVFDKIFRLFTALITIIKCYYSYKEILAHVNTAHSRSFYRKAIFIKLLNFLKIPIVIHLHSSEFHLFFENSSKRQQRFIKNIFISSNKVIVLSKSWKDWYTNNIEPREPKIIYNGMEDFSTNDDSVSKRDNVVLFIGRLGERKGTYDLIKAFHNVSALDETAKLILAGDGEIEECKILAKELHISDKIDFVGWINYQEKKQLLNSAKIFVLPSYNEGFPLSILEAMSTRLPIISTNIGGIPEEIEDKVSGFLITPGDIDALSSYINQLFTDATLCDRIGIVGREKYLHNFTINKIINETLEVYTSIFKKGNE